MVAVRELLTPLPGPRAETKVDMGDVVFFTKRLPALRCTKRGNGRHIYFSVDGNDPLSSLCSGKFRTYDTVQVVGSI